MNWSASKLHVSQLKYGLYTISAEIKITLLPLFVPKPMMALETRKIVKLTLKCLRTCLGLACYQCFALK